MISPWYFISIHFSILHSVDFKQFGFVSGSFTLHANSFRCSTLSSLLAVSSRALSLSHSVPSLIALLIVTLSYCCYYCCRCCCNSSRLHDLILLHFTVVLWIAILFLYHIVSHFSMVSNAVPLFLRWFYFYFCTYYLCFAANDVSECSNCMTIRFILNLFPFRIIRIKMNIWTCHIGPCMRCTPTALSNETLAITNSKLRSHFHTIFECRVFTSILVIISHCIWALILWIFRYIGRWIRFASIRFNQVDYYCFRSHWIVETIHQLNNYYNDRRYPQKRTECR